MTSRSSTSAIRMSRGAGERPPVVLDEVQVARRDPQPLGQAGLGEAPLPAQRADLRSQQGRVVAHRSRSTGSRSPLPVGRWMATAGRVFNLDDLSRGVFRDATDRLLQYARRVASCVRGEQVHGAKVRRRTDDERGRPDAAHRNGVRGTRPPGAERVLNPGALSLVAEVARMFRPRVEELLERRRDLQARLDAGERPGFLPETRPCPRRSLGGGPAARRPARPARRDHRPDRPQDDHQRPQLRAPASSWRTSRTPTPHLAERGRGPAQPARRGASGPSSTPRPRPASGTGCASTRGR